MASGEEDEVIELSRQIDDAERDLVGGVAMLEMDVEVDEHGKIQVVGEDGVRRDLEVDGEDGEEMAGEDENEEDWEDGSEGEEDIWRLGLVEEPEVPEALKAEYFPSKVGGTPAWLDNKNLPSVDQLRCSANNRGEECGRQMAFICQVYAPPPDGPPEAFHRSVFMFACRNPLCGGKPGSARAFRSQLARKNDVYPYEAPDYPTAAPKIFEVEEEDDKGTVVGKQDDMADPLVVQALECKASANESFTAGKHGDAAEGYAKAASLLITHGKWEPRGLIACEYAKIRGNRAECLLQMGKWREAVEECDAALKADPTFIKGLFRRAKARLGMHDAGGGQACGALHGARKDLESATRLDEDCSTAWTLLREVKVKCEEAFSFKEKELVIEEEPDKGEHEDDPRRIEEARHIQELLDKYNSEMNKELKKDAENFFGGDKDEKKDPRDKVDSVYLRFKLRTERVPRQTLRYNFSPEAEPLWVHSEGRLEGPPPVCPRCQAERFFEFQVLPQMLFYLEPETKSGDHEIEWGSLSVYSCSESCGSGGYIEEHVYIQPSPAQHKL